MFARRRAGVLVAIWVLACTAGLALVWRYKATPAEAGTPAPRWPSALGLARADAAPTLIMIAHPRCACTRASLGELEVVLERAPQGVAAYLLFAVPDGVGTDWGHGELYQRARSIRGLQVVEDRGGALARSLGVVTSGHVLVYDAGGALRFSGGITGARGHAGDNVGRARVQALLRGAAPDRDAAYVFGCSIEDPS